MTVLRCTAKLLKRLKQPAKPPEPAPQPNPLGEWYADIHFWNRKPFVMMLNSTTGATLLLNGNADGLRILHERALVQFGSICEHLGIDGPLLEIELDGFAAGFAFSATRDRSLVASINQRKDRVWTRFEYDADSLAEAALLEWNMLFKHPALGRNERIDMDHHRPLDLVRQRLLPAADIFPLGTTRH